MQPPTPSVSPPTSQPRGGRPFAALAVLWDQFAFAGRTLRTMPRALRYWRVIATHMADVAVGAGALIVGAGMLFVIVAIAFFAGTQVGLQGYAALAQVGAESLSGIVASLGNVREISPLVAGIALAAQVGAGFTAELGAQRISEEIDALEVLSVDSVEYLVATRVWAALLTMVPLYLAALFAGFLATELIITGFYSLSSGIYQHYFSLFLPFTDVVASFAKALIFATVVALIHCYYGFHASGGPSGVGVATGRAIRSSIVVVTIVNTIVSIVVWGPRTTARIVGTIGGFPGGWW